MSDFRLTEISNVRLGTTDLARSLAFYRETLGLRVQAEMAGFVFLNVGGVTLSLSEAHAKLTTPVAGGTEIVFRVADVTAAARGTERARRGVSQHTPQRHRRPVGSQLPGS